MKKYFKNLMLLAAAALLLAGCTGHAPTETLPRPTGPAQTLPASPEGNSPESMLQAWEMQLEKQEEITFGEFCKNYEEACALYALGVRPQGDMPVYGCSTDFETTGEPWLESGFYVVPLDAAVFGISEFYVIPAGERALTAEEYLQLAEAADCMPSQKLTRDENAWISLQHRERSNENRAMTIGEKRWSGYEICEVLQGKWVMEEAADQPVAAVVGPADNRAVFWIYPKDEMSPGALQVVTHRQLFCDEAALKKVEKYLCPPEDVDWDAILDAAVACMAEYTDRAELPAAHYFSYQNLASGQEERQNMWAVALYYADGGSYLVQLYGKELDMIQIQVMPEGYYDINGTWAAYEYQRMPYEPVVIYPDKE